MVHYLDVTRVTDREEVAAAFGERAAWQAALTRYKLKEARTTCPNEKRHLRLMLLNAEVQLSLYK